MIRLVFLFRIEIGVSFSVDETATIDPISGSLKFSSGFEESLAQINSEDIKEINYYTNFSSEYLSSSTNIKNILNNSSSNTWNMTIKTPFIIKESIFDREEFKDYQNGMSLGASAQVAVEIIFNRHIKISRVRMNPNVSNGLILMQVITESDLPNPDVKNSFSNKRTEIASAIALNKSTDIDLMGSVFVKSLTLIFAQKDYVRTKITPVQSELNSKMVNEISKAIRVERKKKHDTLQDLVIKFFIKDYAKDFLLRNKKLYNYDYTYYYPTDLSKKSVGVLKELKTKKYYSDLDSFNKFKNTTLLSNMVFSIISYSIGANFRSMIKSTYIESNLKPSINPVKTYGSGGIVPLGDSNNITENIHFLEQTFSPVSQNDITTIISNVEQQNQYEYMFSLKNIAIFETSDYRVSPQDLGKSNNEIISPPELFQIPKRSVYMSKRLDLGGTPIKAKMMAEYFSEVGFKNYSEANDKTSIELSVSIKDNPSREEDWIPVLPYNVNSVRSEILFPDQTGSAALRFLPNEESLKIYENSQRKNYETIQLSGKNIKLIDFNPEKTYHVSYTPRDLNILKEAQLFSRSLAAPVLRSASSDGFNGERFEKTQTDNSVQLANSPYVDNDKFVNAVYSSRNGTLATTKSSLGNFDYSSYSPVKVLLDDGTPGLNLTNYLLNNFQAESFYETDLLLFIHSGKTLIFNKQINQPFRVLYQYIAEVFRYRVILRNLDNTTENYSVDRLIFKFSLQKNDTIVNNFNRYNNRYRNRIV